MENFGNAFETAGANFKMPDVFAEFENFGRETVEVYEPVEGQEGLEKAPPMEVQALEIRDCFLEIPELRYENWVNLDVDERLEALNKMEGYVAEIAKRPVMPVSAEKMEWFGYYSRVKGGLFLSEDVLRDNSKEMYRETLDTLFHEGRHAYQNYNVEGNVVESNQTLVDAWCANENDWEGYTQGDEPSSYIVGVYRENLAADGSVGLKDAFHMVFPPYAALGHEEYYLQPMEVDARAFAAQVIGTLGI